MDLLLLHLLLQKKKRGDIINITDYEENEGRIWCSFEEDGEIYYFCARDTNGEYYISEVNDSNVCMLQKKSTFKAVQNEGCNFLCACYLGGLNNIEEADDCFDWASTTPLYKNSKKMKVDSDDSYVNMDKYALAKEIAQRYGRETRPGRVIKGKNHFYVVDNNGNEIFNSSGPGYGH